MKIYQNQTALDIYIETGVNFNERPVTSAKIKYIDPKGFRSEFTAEIVEDEKLQGVIKVSFTADIKFVHYGEYLLWPSLTYQDGRTALGERVGLQVYREGEA